MNEYKLPLQSTCQVLTEGHLLTKMDEDIKMENVSLKSQNKAGLVPFPGGLMIQPFSYVPHTFLSHSALNAQGRHAPLVKHAQVV